MLFGISIGIQRDFDVVSVPDDVSGFAIDEPHRGVEFELLPHAFLAQGSDVNGVAVGLMLGQELDELGGAGATLGQFVEQAGVSLLNAVGVLIQGLLRACQALFQAVSRFLSLTMSLQLGLCGIDWFLKVSALGSVLLQQSIDLGL